MKRRFLLAILMLTAMFNPMFAGIIDLDVEGESGTQSNGGPRSITSSVQVFAHDDELNLNVDFYSGTAQVSVMSLDGSSMLSNAYYINGHESISLDFSGSPTGQYSIMITLENGKVYNGSFRIE